MPINQQFFISHDQYQHYSDKALEWFIKGWKLGGIDKKIALLYQEKNNKEAMRYLKEANKYLK